MASTLYAKRASRRVSLSACLSPAASSSGTERSESGQRAGESERSSVAAQWSEVERIETPESGIFVGGSLRINQRRPRRAGTSIVTEAIVRSLPPHLSGRGRAFSPQTLYAKRASPRVSRSLACLRRFRQRNGTKRKRPSRGRVGEVGRGRESGVERSGLKGRSQAASRRQSAELARWSRWARGAKQVAQSAAAVFGAGRASCTVAGTRRSTRSLKFL